MNLNPTLLERLVCPACKLRVEVDDLQSELHCPTCSYSVVDGIPIMMIKSKQPEKKDFDYLEHYKKDAEEFDYFEKSTGATEHSERRIREYTTLQIPKEAKSILDVGCGSAWLAKEYMGKEVFICSLDATIVNTSKALKTYPSIYHAAVVADAYKLPFADGSFDCVVAAEIIEHVIDPSAFVKELLRVVSPTGVLVISTPYKEAIRYALCVHCNQKTPLNSHLHSFDENKLRNIYDPVSAISFKWIAFNNKLLVFARTYTILRYLPFTLWRIIDSCANTLFDNRLNIITKVVKK